MRRALALLLPLTLAAPLAGCDLQRMTEQGKVKPYAPSTFFADGAAMRVPPAGTVPRERVLGASIAPPVTRVLLERGRERFRIFCAACHGVLGDGQTVVADRMKLRRPRSLQEEGVRHQSPAKLYETITRGFGLMPSHERALSIEERWAVVAYVKALELSQSVPLGELPPDVAAEASASLGERDR
jgi:mono/diheme cytochrome c family protein